MSVVYYFIVLPPGPSCWISLSHYRPTSHMNPWRECLVVYKSSRPDPSTNVQNLSSQVARPGQAFHLPSLRISAHKLQIIIAPWFKKRLHWTCWIDPLRGGGGTYPPSGVLRNNLIPEVNGHVFPSISPPCLPYSYPQFVTCDNMLMSKTDPVYPPLLFFIYLICVCTLYQGLLTN
jgi:hypothetical protein